MLERTGSPQVTFLPLHAPRVMTVPATAVYFTAYDQLKAFLCGQSLTSDLYAPMVAGALARMGTVTVISPLELVRTKLQAQHVSYRELATCVQASVAQGGWRSLWLGWGPTALRDVPFSGRHLGSGHRVKGPLDNVQGLSSQVPPLLLMAMNLSLLRALGSLFVIWTWQEGVLLRYRAGKPAPGVGGEKSGAHYGPHL